MTDGANHRLSVFLTIPTIGYEARVLCTRFFVPDEDVGRWMRVVVSFGLIGSAAVVASAVPDVGFVFGVVGSTAATIISFVFPPAFYLRVCCFVVVVYGLKQTSSMPKK